MNISIKQVKIKETVFERDNPVHDFGEDGNEGHAKGLLAMWCSWAMIGRYEKARVNVLTTIMTD